MKVVIAGSRYKDKDKKIAFDDYGLVVKAIKESGYDITEVVCGKAIGVDSLGEQWAIANDVGLSAKPADWNKHGKAAGPIRNREMAEYCDAAIIIWDGKSTGSYNMIQEMIRVKKPHRVVVSGSRSIEEFM